eukprot:9088004-Lingulodinium_polyedra.AAC.1
MADQTLVLGSAVVTAADLRAPLVPRGELVVAGHEKRRLGVELLGATRATTETRGGNANLNRGRAEAGLIEALVYARG